MCLSACSCTKYVAQPIQDCVSARLLIPTSCASQQAHGTPSVSAPRKLHLVTNASVPDPALTRGCMLAGSPHISAVEGAGRSPLRHARKGCRPLLRKPACIMIHLCFWPGPGFRKRAPAGPRRAALFGRGPHTSNYVPPRFKFSGATLQHLKRRAPATRPGGGPVPNSLRRQGCSVRICTIFICW